MATGQGDVAIVVSQKQPPGELLTPSQRVVNIVELLEQILLHLPMVDLLLAQRVCRRWRALIIHSVHLQRALFLRPAPSGPLKPLLMQPQPTYLPRDRSVPVKMNCLIAPCTKRPYPTTYRHATRFRLDQGCILGLWHTVHPDAAYSDKRNAADRIFTDYTVTRRAEPDPLSSTEVSWWRMFLTQPPVTLIKLVDDMSRFCFVSNEDGVTMGDVVGKAEQFYGRKGQWALLDWSNRGPFVVRVLP
ncbi:hypothetical protein B0A49_03031 [Cryomyces minteri]|uniref:F-box domain-containing protein n=1 Tax=Cryomyces minteri TaxID=331657 RepID=A0A4U0X8J6_9PEZI|nr:hypothetical protein B0A49_03031 [Cryomyces minteri]